jgi:transforming growth factor-beta-induced protein
MSKTTLRWIFPVLLSLAPVLAFGACGSDDDTTAMTSTDRPKTIVETAVAAGSFNKLVAAVTAAGLADTLSGPGPFTVFAPTDEAFAKLPAGTVEDLLRPENRDKLRSILTYHVVAGRVPAAEVVKLTSAKTVQGQSVKIEVQGQTVRVDGARITSTDVNCSNGIIHVIDSVLLPQ